MLRGSMGTTMSRCLAFVTSGKWFSSPRLETRTKESNMRASSRE